MSVKHIFSLRWIGRVFVFSSFLLLDIHTKVAVQDHLNKGDKNILDQIRLRHVRFHDTTELEEAMKDRNTWSDYIESAAGRPDGRPR